MARRVVLLEEIPKGPAGKLQRIGLADRLGMSMISFFDAPTVAVQAVILEEMLLKGSRISQVGAEYPTLDQRS